jgi:hypothetical protein
VATPETDGIVLHSSRPGAWVFVEDWIRIRDACVRASVRAIDGAATFGLMLRRAPIGDGARTFYMLEVSPQTGCARLARCFATKEELGATPLVDWRRVTAVAPGVPIELELRAQGTALEAWVGGAPLAALHDPALGIGFVGLRVAMTQGAGQTVRIACRGFEVRQVAS